MSGSRQRSIGQPFDDSLRREPSVPIEELVGLSSAVPHSPPERTEDGTRAGRLQSLGQFAWSGSIEDDGEHVGLRDRLDELDNGPNLDQVHRFTDDPAQLDESTGATSEERDWTEPDNDRHGDIVGRRGIRRVEPDGR